MHPHARIIGPTERHVALLGQLPIGSGHDGNLVSDAHLAAIATELGSVLGTFDRDFERFAGLRIDWQQGDAVHETRLLASHDHCIVTMAMRCHEMETEISKSRFKAHALEIFRNIEKSGTPVIITDNGTPVLSVTKYRAHARNALSRLKGSVLRFDQPTAPVEELWEADA